MDAVKKCVRCGAEFSGKRSDARFCKASCAVAWAHKADAEKRRIAARERYQADPAAARAKRLPWRTANAESLRANNRERYLNNLQSIRLAALEWAARNPERKRQNNAAWKKANPEQTRLDNNRRRVALAGAAGSHTSAEWLAICKRQNGKCIHCGLKLKLTRDHIVPLSRGGTDFAFNIQGLCGSCNTRKGAKILTNASPSLFDREGSSNVATLSPSSSREG